MRIFIWISVLWCILTGCNQSTNEPDVSRIKVQLTTQRFEQDFFSLDTLQFKAGLEKLLGKYPGFGQNFISTILNTDPSWSADTALDYIKSFKTTYQPVYDTSQKVFADFTPYENLVKKSMQYVSYYFPKYPLPKKIITYIGPMDGYGDILDVDAFAVGLHQHLGSNYTMYKSEMVRITYPDYLSNQFTPDYIAVNCMKNVVLDMFPEKLEDKTLVIQMVEKGKRIFLLKKFVPFAEDHQVIGYTKKQYSDCIEREAMIWNLFIQNDILQSIDNSTIKNYIGESPKTAELGEASPGNIGSFCGWQIVKKFMDKFPGTSLESLMSTDPEIIFQKTKYKP